MTAITSNGAVEGPIVEKKKNSALSGGFGVLQRLGKSLMLPIAVLPAAGLLLRLGQDDLLGRIQAPIIGPFFHAMSAAGGALFDNLPLLFAVGVAIGFAKKADASTAMAAVVGYLIMTNVFNTMSPVILGEGGGSINFGVFAGLLTGIISALLFDRYHNKKLHPYLGFFGGRRFVPIVVALASLFLGFLLSYIYPLFDRLLQALGNGITHLGPVGAFIYGFVNRMLIPLGLHHIVNSYIWFGYGDYTTAAGNVVTGELTRFAQGDPTAGIFTSGFYPILMFGLPAAALAMIHMANKKHRHIAIGILAAAAFTAFLTGVTEPLEFAFMFVAFPLYVIHAILTGLSLAIAYILRIHLGFSFSAGLIDLLLYGTAPAASNIPLLIIQGLIFAALYYFLFRFAIKKWNLRTPGRDIDDDEFTAVEDATQPAVAYAGGVAPAARVTEYVVPAAATTVATAAVVSNPDSEAEKVIAAFGGRDNLVNVDACITRLRMEVKDPALVDRNGLKRLGAAGVIDVGNNVQAVFGPHAEILKGEILDVL